VFALESDNIKLRTKYVKLKAALQAIQDERHERRLKKQQKKTHHSVDGHRKSSGD